MEIPQKYKEEDPIVFKKTNFLFFNEEKFDDSTTINIAKFADVIVYLINEDINEKKLKLFKQIGKNYIFVHNKDFKKGEVRKFIKNNFSKIKISNFENLLECLIEMELKNEREPAFFPSSCTEKNDTFILEGFLRNKIFDNKIFYNNGIESEILNIEAINSETCDAFCDLDQDDYLKSYCLKDECDESDSESGFINDQEESMASEEENEIGEAKIFNRNPKIEINPEKENIIEKFKDFKSMKYYKRTPNKEVPEYYKELVYLRKEVELQDFNKRVRITIKKESEEKPIILFSLPNFFRENKTIYNINFNCELPRVLLAEIGGKVCRISPIISEDTKNSVSKGNRDLTKGVFTFIGPIMRNTQKINFYDGNVNFENFLFSSIRKNNSNKIILHEKKLVGRAVKVYKKYCKISKMFESKSDLMFFKDNFIYSKTIKGKIVKTIGEFGYFKALFERPVKQKEDIVMPLFKRIFPRDYNL